MSVPRDRGRFSEGGNLVVNSIERVYYPDDGRDQTNRLPVLPMSVVYAPPQKSFTDSQLFEEEGTHHEEQPVKIYYYFPLFLILASIADIVLMGVAIWLNHGFEPFSVNPFYGPSVDVLIEMGAKDVQKIQQDYEVWRFVVPIFLHAGLIHLAFNLLFQLQCFMIERQCGFFRIGIVYMLAGIGGNILSSIFAPNIISVGASGSLFGLIGTMLVMILINWRYTWRPLFNLSFLIILLVLALGLGLLPMVDNWTHIGGLVIGFLTSMVVVPSIGRPYSCCRAMLSLVCIGLVVALYGVGLWAIFGDKLHLKDWCGDVCDKIDCYDFGQKWWNCTAYES